MPEIQRIREAAAAQPERLASVLQAWLAEDLPTSTEVPTPDAKTFPVDEAAADVMLTKDDMRLARLGPDQAFAIFAHPTPDAEPHLQDRLKGKAYTTDQTDVWTGLIVAGPAARTAAEQLRALLLKFYAQLEEPEVLEDDDDDDEDLPEEDFGPEDRDEEDDDRPRKKRRRRIRTGR